MNTQIDRWLSWLAVMHVIGGLCLPLLLLFTSWFDGWLPLQSPSARVAFAVLGPTVASWGAMMFYLVQYGIRNGHRWAADALIVGVLVWAPLDAALCWRYELTVGWALDAVVSLAMLVPLLIRRFTLSPPARPL